MEDATTWVDVDNSDRLCGNKRPLKNLPVSHRTRGSQSTLESQRLLWNHKSPQLWIQDFVEGGGVIYQKEGRSCCSRQEMSRGCVYEYGNGVWCFVPHNNGRKMEIK